jgi:TonB family protein
MRPLFPIAALCMSLALGLGQTDAGASLEQYRREIEANPSSSLAHYRIAEILFQQKNYQSAANEFRESLNGDLQPAWVEGQIHIKLGTIFDLTGQHDRALNEYQLATQAIHRNSTTSSDNPSGIVAPQPLQKTEPEYSEEARLAGLEGAVLLTGTITAEGVARDMRVTGSLGFGLDERALAAIQQWRFTPGTLEGRPVPVAMTVPVEFHLPDKQSRWHLIRAEFTPPEGASRPQFSKTSYPYGIGISLHAFEEALVIRAIGREATATVAFDVDEHGSPVNVQVLNASHPIWGPEAMAVLHEWQFVPGMKSGAPVSARCTVDLVWGPTDLTPKDREWAVAQMSSSLVPWIPEPIDAAAVASRSTPAVAYKVEPSYTDEAQKAGLQGTVVLRLVIKEDGTPTDIQVLKPLALGLSEKAVEAVNQWRFQPAKVNGQPVSFPATVEVNFRLPE